MEVNDIDGYIVTGSAEGDIKVCWGRGILMWGSTEGCVGEVGEFYVGVN